MADESGVASADLCDQIIDALRRWGPTHEDDLIAELEQRGVEMGDPDLAFDEVVAIAPVVALKDWRWAYLPALLDGRVFTHRLTGDEAEHDALHINPDLEPLALLMSYPDFARLADGAAITQSGRDTPRDAIGEYGCFVLHSGRLREIGAGSGDVVALGVTSDGLRLESVAEPTAADDLMEVLRRRFDAVLALDPDQPSAIDSAVWTACADDPSLFAQPLPPLGSLVDALGLATDAESLAHRDFDFDRWRFETEGAYLARQYELNEDETVAVQVAITLHKQLADLLAAAADQAEQLDDLLDDLPASPLPAPEDDDTGVIHASLGMLAEPVVAEAVLSETADIGGRAAVALGLFAETFEPKVPREARPALRWLRAKASELLDDVADAEAGLEAAEAMDPNWPPTLIDLAHYASDRGDAVRALNLLRRADTPPDDPLRQLLERFQPAQRSDLGRNDPCWCGSGRKYKKCHLNHEEQSLGERADWLYRKAAMFIHDGRWLGDLIEVAAERATRTEADDALFAALADPLVTDTVLFEGGALADFVSTRGALLPEDERALAARWLEAQRSVFEVQDVHVGNGVTVRDVRSGDVHQVRDAQTSERAKDGELLCTRVAPAGDTAQFFGGAVLVEPGRRDGLLELLDSAPSALDLVAFLSSGAPGVVSGYPGSNPDNHSRPGRRSETR